MKSILRSIHEIDVLLRRQMFLLMGQYYDNLSFEKFTRDLTEKDQLILLMEEEKLCGFTTLKQMALMVEGRRVRGIFSGDTIVERGHAFSLELQRAFIQNMLHLIEEDVPLYWFLLCKGYKTWRYLPLYFKKYYPYPREDTPPFEKELMDCYARAQYGDAYDPLRGIVLNRGGNDYLKQGVAEIDDRRMKREEIAFFVQKNPGHVRGDELVCLAEFCPSNMTPLFRRMVGVK